MFPGSTAVQKMRDPIDCDHVGQVHFWVDRDGSIHVSGTSPDASFSTMIEVTGGVRVV